MESGIIKLTEDQDRAFKMIMSGADTFVTGGAGTGKSALIREVIRELERQGRNVVICAPTGTAAVNIGGTTIHRVFGFGTGPCVTEKLHKLRVRTPQLVCMADVIIIDEVSMCRMDMMDAVCASVVKARHKSVHPVQLVVVGDFCQLPPVIAEDTGERQLLEEHYGHPIGNAFAFQAPGWAEMKFRTVTLETIVRQEDGEFIFWLNKLRIGDAEAIRYFNEHAVRGGDRSAINLCAYNSSVNRTNRQELDRLPGEMVVFNPIYRGADTVELPEPIYLKKGANVIITTNNDMYSAEDIGATLKMYRYNRENTFHNGSTGVVEEISVDRNDPNRDYVIVSLSNGTVYMFYRQVQDLYDYSVDETGMIHREVVGSISQIPLKPGYSITIHRSQGQTYDSINLDPSCWCTGQLYVALSRLRSIGGLHLTKPISVGDIHLDPLVRDFYLGENNCLNSEEKRADAVFPIKEEAPVSENETRKKSKKAKPKKKPGTKAGGRPARYPNGSQVIRIPTELKDDLGMVLSIICPKGGMNTSELERFRSILQEMCR